MVDFCFVSVLFVAIEMLMRRSLNNRALTARTGAGWRKSISTPRASVVAQIQASYALTRPMSNRKLVQATTSKNKFIEDIEQQITDELQQCCNAVEEFAVYQRAFQCVIDHFEAHSSQMAKVKEGYDKIIEKMRAECKQYAKRSMEVFKSQSELNGLVDKQREKYEKKRQNFIQLEKLTIEQSDELRKEIKQLEEDLAVQRVENRNSQSAAHGQWLALQDLRAKQDKKQAKCDRIKKDLEEMVVKENEMGQEIERLHGEIASTLDSILVLKHERNDINHRIDDLQEQIQGVRDELEKKEQKINESQQEMARMSENTKSIGEEINKLNKDTERLIEQVRELVRSRRGRVIPAEIMDDPVKLLAMYLDHC